jgi:hypothetical protein
MDQYDDWALNAPKKWPEIFALAGRLLDEAKVLAGSGELRGNDHPGVVRALLFGRVLSGTRGLVLLAKNGLLVEADSQFRSNMEALFRLSALVEDASLLPRYLGEDFARRRRAMQDVRNLLSGSSSITAKDIDDTLAAIDREESSFRKQHGLDVLREIKIWEWVQAGGQTDFFWGKYVLHSGVTHHSARDLERRLRLSDDGKEIEAILFHPDTESPEEIIADGLLLLVRAMILYAKGAGVELPSKTNGIKQELDQLFEKRVAGKLDEQFP